MRLIKWQRLEEEWANGMLELKDIITKQFQKTFIRKYHFKLLFSINQN